MTYESILGTGGFLLAIIAFYYTILPILKKKSENKISIIINSYYKLLQINNANFGNLQIEYNNQKVSDNLTYTKLTILNSGYNDIICPKTKPFRFNFPAEIEIIDYKLTYQSNNEIDLNIDSKINQTNITWDLLKKNEYFILEYIFRDTIKNRTKYFDIFKTDHRIPNLNEIEILGKAPDEKRSKRIWNTDLPTFSFLLFALFFFGFLMNSFLKSIINPKIVTNKNFIYKPTNEKVDLFLASLDSVEIHKVDEKNVLETISYYDLKKKILYHENIEVEHTFRYYIALISIFLLFLLMCYMILFNIKRVVRDEKLLRVYHILSSIDLDRT